MNDDQLDDLAKQLKHEWESPRLWSKIEREARGQNRVRWGALAALGAIAAATVFAVFLWRGGGSAGGGGLAGGAIVSPLLSEQAMAEVEAAENAYRKSIDRLAAVAAPKIERRPATALQQAYVARLALIDGAIAELRRELDHNEFNTHLRLQLATLYRDKQETLQGLIQHD